MTDQTPAFVSADFSAIEIRALSSPLLPQQKAIDELTAKLRTTFDRGLRTTIKHQIFWLSYQSGAPKSVQA